MPRPKNTNISVTYIDLDPFGNNTKTVFSAPTLSELVEKLVIELKLEEPNTHYVNEDPEYGRKKLAKELAKSKWVTIDPYTEEIGEGRRILLLAKTLEELEEEYKDSVMSI